MIRKLIALVPPAHRRLLPRFLSAVVLLGVAQGIAYALLAPLLESVFAERLDEAWRWLIVLLGALVVVAASSYVQALLGLRLGIGMMNDLQSRLGDHLNRLPLGWFGPATAGSASRVIISATREVMGVFAHLFTPLVTAVLTPVTVAIAMLFVDWRVTAAMAVSAPVLFLVNKWGNGIFARSAERMHDAAAAANSRVIEFAQAQPVLRAFGALDAGDRRLEDALQGQRRATRSMVWASVPGLVVFSFVVQLTFILLVWLLVAFATGGELSVPVAIALIAVSARFIEPLNQAAEMGSSIRAAAVAADRITGLLATEPVPEPLAPAQPENATVKFEAVSFGYEPGRPVISEVTFEAPAGTTTAIVGPSGSGKTTLLRLAARFADTDAGRIELGGSDIRAYESETLLGQLSLVFQDVYLFDQTVEENIRIGRPGADDEAIRYAAATARVDEIADRLPDGWDTRVGEGGTALSGGERQRISIARALLKNSPVVLLDEATSALDPQNEAAVMHGIRELTEGKTVLVVAHRLATIRHADQILFLDSGRIVERGSHDELVALGSRYAAFWNERSRAAGWRLTSG